MAETSCNQLLLIDGFCICICSSWSIASCHNVTILLASFMPAPFVLDTGTWSHVWQLVHVRNDTLRFNIVILSWFLQTCSKEWRRNDGAYLWVHWQDLQHCPTQEAALHGHWWSGQLLVCSFECIFCYSMQCASVQFCTTNTVIRIDYVLYWTYVAMYYCSIL